MWVRFSFEAQGENETAMDHKAMKDAGESESSILEVLISELPGLVAMAREFWVGPRHPSGKDEPEVKARVDAEFNSEPGVHPADWWYSRLSHSGRCKITCAGGEVVGIAALMHQRTVFVTENISGTHRVMTLREVYDRNGPIQSITRIPD